jgi:nucleotidyltransferase/DNA polymerase involved in DNA repair
MSQDCFYASVFENETPSLKALPLAVQQKQIVVTCNYEARRRVGPPARGRAAAAALQGTSQRCVSDAHPACGSSTKP